MTWEAAVTQVDQDIVELTEHFRDKIPAHPAPKILALRVLLARERNRFHRVKQEN
jgi:hypothetical protein